MLHKNILIALAFCLSPGYAFQAYAKPCQDENETFKTNLEAYPELAELQGIVNQNLELLRKHSEAIQIAANQQHCQWLEKRNELLKNPLFSYSPEEWSTRCQNFKAFYTHYLELISEQNKLLDSLKLPVVKNYPKSIIPQNDTNHLALISSQWSYDVSTLNLDGEVVEKHDMQHTSFDYSCGSVHLQFFNLPSYPEMNEIITHLLSAELKAVKLAPETGRAYSQVLYNQRYYDYAFQEELLTLNPTFISLKHKFYEFSGGAHGNHALFLYTLDRKKQAVMKLEDLISPTMKNAFLEAARKAFINANQLNPNESFQSQGYWFEPSREHANEQWRLSLDFYVPENFALTDDGILFIYHTYEVASYALGSPSFFLPWAEFKPYLTDNFACLPECSD